MLIIGLLRLIWALFVISVPLAGIWIASSMAALSNSPIWVACLIGALAFPIIPIAWEILGELLRRRAKARGPKRLSDLRSVGTGFMSGDDRALTHGSEDDVPFTDQSRDQGRVVEAAQPMPLDDQPGQAGMGG